MARELSRGVGRTDNRWCCLEGRGGVNGIVAGVWGRAVGERGIVAGNFFGFLNWAGVDDWQFGTDTTLSGSQVSSQSHTCHIPVVIYMYPCWYVRHTCDRGGGAHGTALKSN